MLESRRIQILFGVSVALVASRQAWALFIWPVAGAEIDFSDAVLLIGIVVSGITTYRNPRVIALIRQTVESNKFAVGTLAVIVIGSITSGLLLGNISELFSFVGSALRVVAILFISVALLSELSVRQLVKSIAFAGIIVATISLLWYGFELTNLAESFNSGSDTARYNPPFGFSNTGKYLRFRGFAENPIAAGMVFGASMIATIWILSNGARHQGVYFFGGIVVWAVLVLTLARSVGVTAVAVFLVILGLTVMNRKYGLRWTLVTRYAVTGAIGVVLAGTVMMNVPEPLSTPTAAATVEPIEKLGDTVRSRFFNSTTPRTACHYLVLEESFETLHTSLVGHGAKATPEGSRIVATRLGICR